VRLLLDAGADVDADAGGFGNPAQAAVKFGHHDVTKVLKAFEMSRNDECIAQESQKSAP
jgi:hypothetical protein